MPSGQAGVKSGPKGSRLLDRLGESRPGRYKTQRFVTVARQRLDSRSDSMTPGSRLIGRYPETGFEECGLDWYRECMVCRTTARKS